MRLIVVNTKQKIAVLASGLAVATTGFVTDENSAASPIGRVAAPAAVVADPPQEDEDAGGGPQRPTPRASHPQSSSSIGR
jgi:hypothetical protein